MASPFEIASAVESIGPNRFAVHVPSGWEQGRGAFGGLVLGTMLRAMTQSEPDHERLVRTLSGDIAGPVVPGEAEVRVFVVRRGSNQTNLRAELVQGSSVLALASVVLSSARPSLLGELRPRIDRPTPHGSLRRATFEGASVPVFTRHFEYRPVGEHAAPFSSAPEPVTSGWIREAVVPSEVDAPMLVALLDAWWPASLVTATRPRPAATIAFAAQLLVDPRALDPEGALFHQARSVTEHDGFQLESRTLYDAAGNAVAMNQQTFAVLA